MVSRNNTLTVHFDGDTKDFAKAIKQVNGDLSGFERSTRGAQGAMAGLQSSFSSFALGATVVVGTIAGAIATVRNFASAASDLEESQSKVGVVFGESAGQIRQWSENASSALGMSQRQALEAAGTYGNFFQALGLTRDAAVSMSPAVVQLASDLASFNNASPEETLLALRSGLSGEVEPLRKYGVAINAAAVEQEAMRLGLQKVNGEFAESAKVQARYSLIMSQTSAAQGDFARTSDGLANQNRSLTANFEELRAKLGAGVSPALADATKKLNDWMKSAEAEQTIENLSKAMSDLAEVTLGVVGALGDAYGALSTLVRSSPYDIAVRFTTGGESDTGGASFKDLTEALFSGDPEALDKIFGTRNAARSQPSGSRGEMSDAESALGGVSPIRTREQRFADAARRATEAMGPIVPLPKTALDNLTPEEESRRRLASDAARQRLEMAALPDFADALKAATGGVGGVNTALADLDKRMAEAFEITEIRNLQLAHKVMEEAELAAAAGAREFAKASEESAQRMRAGIDYINGLNSAGVKKYAPGVFETIAGAFGLNTNFTTATVDGVDVMVP